MVLLQKTQRKFVARGCRGVVQGLVLYPIVPGYTRQHAAAEFLEAELSTR